MSRTSTRNESDARCLSWLHDVNRFGWLVPNMYVYIAESYDPDSMFLGTHRRIFGFIAAAPRRDLRTRPSDDEKTCLVDMRANREIPLASLRPLYLVVLRLLSGFRTGSL